MGVRKRVAKAPRGKAKASLPLLEEIEESVEAAVRRLLAKENLEVADLVKLRDVVREILAERPHEVVVRWVDSCEGTNGTAGGKTGEKAGDRSGK